MDTTHTLTVDDVFDVVRSNLIEVLPELRPEQILPTATMSELGANSLDRTDVVIATQDDLGIVVPAARLARVSDIGSLVRVLHEYV